MPARYRSDVTPGFLTVVHPVLLVAALLGVAIVLAYVGAPLWVWAVGAAALLYGLAAPVWVWIVVGVPLLVLLVRPLRRRLLSAPIMKVLDTLGVLPTIGDTERIALEAGTTWIEGEFFTGKPDLGRVLSEPWPELTEAERAFLDGPVEELCAMTTDYEIREVEDLPGAVWDFVREEGFLGMAIPEEFGGLGFSANGMRAVVGKLASRSLPLTVDVMVPNSLGPAELLVHYGTDEQKARWLPDLAAGEEIPCFALTEPEAGSDAASLSSRGEVFCGDDGELHLRLDWEKRYITLAPVATVIGLAFRLFDPENLLGEGEEPGITVALVPTGLDGVRLGRRHDPLRAPFINGPTEGEDVVVPIDAIIGGAEQAGHGWRMLMETLAGGRGIFLPALSAGGTKIAARVTGAYARVRRQFGLPIGRFEGIEELLASIGGLSWLLDAMSTFTCGGLDEGKKPAVVSAIAKYQGTEINRQVLNHAMDLLGGKGIVLGPRNLLGWDYVSAPISVTVEGSNVVTRSLIVFGQGLIRSHPYAFDELTALQEGDVERFDRALWAHAGSMVRTKVRAVALELTRGRLASSPVDGPTADLWRRLTWSATRFALMADVALLVLGGELKRKEKLSGRFADALAWMYLAACGLRRFEAAGRPEGHLPFVRWSVEHALGEVQRSKEGVLENFPGAIPGWPIRTVAAWWVRANPIGRGPDDRVGGEIARALQTPGEVREEVLSGTFVPHGDDEPLAVLERALRLAVESEEAMDAVKRALRDGTLDATVPKQAVDQALDRGVIDEERYATLREAERLREEVVAVDAFDLDDLPVNLPRAEARRDDAPARG